MKPMPANRSFYCRAKYNNQEKYYRAIEGRSHDNFHMCIYTRIVFFLRQFYFALSYNSVHRHEHHCRSFPLDEVRIPRRTAARAHFVVINKGARQFNLNSATR